MKDILYRCTLTWQVLKPYPFHVVGIAVTMSEFAPRLPQGLTNGKRADNKNMYIQKHSCKENMKTNQAFAIKSSIALH